MSRVVLGVGASHSTLMNTHWDEVDHLDRAHRFRDSLGEARDAVAAARPDAVVVVGSNHFRGLWLDLLPTFVLGVGECIASGESGTPEGPQPVDVELARHLCGSLVADGFDIAFSTRLQIDHGQAHALQYLLDGLDVSIVPLTVNVFAPPLPTMARCEALGGYLGRAVEADGLDKRVVVVGSGGLSHRVPFPRWDAPGDDDDRFMVEAFTAGRQNWQDYDARRRRIVRSASPQINEEFDRWVLDLLAGGRLAELASWSTEDVEATAGNGAQELRSWLVMAAACGHAAGRVLSYSAMPEWLTGMGVALVEPEVEPEEEKP